MSVSLTKPHKICYDGIMSPGTQVGVSNQYELIESLLHESTLLSDEAKAALLQETKQATDPEEASRIVAFLKDEKQYILSYLRYLLKENRIPKEIPDLMSDLRRDYLVRMKRLESEDVERASDVLAVLNLI